MYCLFASEISALIGSNRYKSKDDVIIRIWKKFHKRDYNTCKSKLDDECNHILQSEESKAMETVKLIEENRTNEITLMISNLTQNKRPADIKKSIKRVFSYDPLVNVLPLNVKKCKIEKLDASIDEILQCSFQKTLSNNDFKLKIPTDEVIKILNHNSPTKAVEEMKRLEVADDATCKRLMELTSLQSATDLASNISLPTITDSVNSACENVNTATAVKNTLKNILNDNVANSYVKNVIHTEIGKRNENLSLNMFEKNSKCEVIHRNSKGYNKRIKCNNWSFVIYGKVDGLKGTDCVIEAKQRQNRLFGRLLEREKIQLYTYLFLTGRKCGILVETYGNEQNEFNIEFDEKVWQQYMERIQMCMSELHILLTDDDNNTRIEMLRRNLY